MGKKAVNMLLLVKKSIDYINKTSYTHQKLSRLKKEACLNMIITRRNYPVGDKMGHLFMIVASAFLTNPTHIKPNPHPPFVEPQTNFSPSHPCFQKCPYLPPQQFQPPYLKITQKFHQPKHTSMFKL